MKTHLLFCLIFGGSAVVTASCKKDNPLPDPVSTTNGNYVPAANALSASFNGTPLSVDVVSVTHQDNMLDIQSYCFDDGSSMALFIPTTAPVGTHIMGDGGQSYFFQYNLQGDNYWPYDEATITVTLNNAEYRVIKGTFRGPMHSNNSMDSIYVSNGVFTANY